MSSTGLSSEFLRGKSAPTICFWAGILGAAAGIFLAVVPASVPDDRYSYPLSATGHIWMQLFFGLHHLGLVVGLFALMASGIAGHQRSTSIGHWLGITGMVMLSMTELLAISAADSPLKGTRADLLGIAYGISCTLAGVGLVMVGIGAIRARRWDDWRRYLPFALGAWVFVPLFPALAGPFLLARLAITGWMLLFAALGWSLMPQTSVSAGAARPA